MRDKLEQLFYFGLGSALLAKEKMNQATETTRSFREESDRKAREFYEEAVRKGSEERGPVKGMLKDLIKEVVEELNLATRSDVAALREEIAQLRRDQQRYGD